MHELHHEVRPSGFGGAGVEHPGDVLVGHHRQRLPLGLEAGDDLTGVEPRLDQLERDPAADGELLLGHEDGAEPALADALEQLVTPDQIAGLFAWNQGIERPGLLDCRDGAEHLSQSLAEPGMHVDVLLHHRPLAATQPSRILVRQLGEELVFRGRGCGGIAGGAGGRIRCEIGLRVHHGRSPVSPPGMSDSTSLSRSNARPYRFAAARS